ncbi:MAG: ATP-binding protein [Lacisediminihabitans sp.]
MAARPAASAATTARQPRSPISRRQIETVVSRTVAIIGVVFAAQTFPITLGQYSSERPGWGLVVAVGVYGSILLMLVSAFSKRFVSLAGGLISIVWLLAMATWPLTVSPSMVNSPDRPWLWYLCTIATGAAALAFRPWIATVYLIVAPVAYGLTRTAEAGGSRGWGPAALDTAYAVILGGAVLIIITLLRQAAASVDAAQATALDRYAHAVRQHATEVERVQVDSIVHDSVLTTLLSAAAADTPEAKALVATMARNAMGHLKSAAAASPDDDATVTNGQLAHRIMGATATLSAPFELRTADIRQGSIPVHAAEAIYSAAVQAMVNSLQHAGAGRDIMRWLSIRGTDPSGIQVDIGDTGAGFDTTTVPTERLGLRVSIVERVANAGGAVEINSTLGEGTVISIHWPDPVSAPSGQDDIEATERVLL